jgi:glycosyltransferase involved in cell wall biosynthesis
MVIAIDGYEANVDKRVGIGRYAFEILRNLYILGEEPIGNKERIQFRVYLPDKPKIDMPKETYWWQYRVVGPRALWTFVGLPLWLTIDRPQADVVFSPTHYIPRFTAIPKAMSIMDLSYLTYPQLFRKKDLHQLTHWTAYSVNHASGVFTISEFSKHAIIEAYQIPKSRVIVTYPGFSMDTPKINRDIHKKYRCSPSYILSVGTIQPRKNFTLLVEAFAKYCTNTKDKETDLLIVGKKGWLYDQILNAPKKFGIEERVKFLSFVPETDLPSLYAEAQCFCLPSLYEGFGLPVLEAMAAGCPVVVSNSSSLPEIAGKAGIYVDPLDADSIAKGLEKALKEKDTAEGKKRIAFGGEQIKKFTWEHAAKETLKVLKEVAGS